MLQLAAGGGFLALGLSRGAAQDTRIAGLIDKAQARTFVGERRRHLAGADRPALRVLSVDRRASQT
jgi:hypothetical protein